MKTALLVLRHSDGINRLKAGFAYLMLVFSIAAPCFCCYTTALILKNTYTWHQVAAETLAKLQQFCGPSAQLSSATIQHLTTLRQNAIISLCLCAVAVLLCLIIQKSAPSLAVIAAKPCLGYQPIRANHGRTLSKVMRGLRNEPVEYFCIFDPVTRLKTEEFTSLCLDGVDFAGDYYLEILGKTGAIQLHNHPFSNSAFSDGDIVSAIQLQASASIVVASEMVYILTLTEACWQLDPDDVESFYNDYLDYRLENVHHRRLPNGKITNISRADAKDCLIDVCQATAEQFGFGFESLSYREALKRFKA